MFHCDWSVAGRLMRQMSLTRTHHATVVGPIRFSNRSNNCRVCKINGRQLSLVRTHHATIVFSSSLRPTDDKNRMVCAGLSESFIEYSWGSVKSYASITIRLTGLNSVPISQQNTARKWEGMSCWSQPGVNYHGLINTIARPTDYHKYMSIINAAEYVKF